jgi:hypothetical protein
MKEKRFFHDIPDTSVTVKLGASRDVMPSLGNPSAVSLESRTQAGALRLACWSGLPYLKYD